MPVDYAEPTKLQDFKVEVFQPGRDTPTLTKPANSPTYETAPGQLTVPNRDTGLGKPNNLPERQNSLRNDGQYRTIDVTPNTTAKPAPSKQLNQLGNGTAGEAAIAEAAYYAGFLIDGIIDGLQNKNFENDSLELKRTVLEDISYNTGNMAGNEARDLTEDAIKNSEKLLDDLWRNKPTFEIPQVKIPKFDIPELPDLEPPKFPDFKFPEISFPKPQSIPIPKPKPKPPKPTFTPPPFDPNGYDLCGTVYLTIAFGWKLLGYIYDEKTGGNIPTRIPVGVEAFAAQYRQCFPESAAEATTQDIVDSADTTGSFSYYEISGVTIKQIVNLSRAVNHNCASLNPPFRRYHYPVYFIGSSDIVIYGNKPGVIPELLRKLTTSEFKPEVIKVQSSSKSRNCTYPILPPPPSSPPPPPPEDDCCRMGCCPKPTEIDYRLIKALVDQTLKEQKFAIQVPICKCEFNNKTNKWTPKTDTVTMEVFATSQLQANQLAQLHLENARQAADLCLARNAEEPIAAIPQSWQIRHEGGKPQLVIHCAEKKEDGKYDSAKYPITVPHWKGKVTDKPSLPPYKKGNWEGILVLADNSKVTINAANEAECTKILNAIKPWINSEMLKGSYFKGGKINVDIKQTQVKAMYGRYFKEGQKNGKPDWRVDFP